MISNAIPGVANVNTFANTNSAKGIAATNSVSKDFQKTLGDISSQKQSAAANVSITKTLSNANSAQTIKQADTSANTDNVKDKVQEFNNADATKKADKATEESAAVNKSDNTKADETTNIKDDNSQDTTEVSEVTENIAESATATVNPEEETGEADEAMAAMLEAARQLMEQLADELGLDIEDIENAMQTLGLTNLAILDNTNMTQIIAEVSGADDMMAIVTNADLYLSVQDMQDAVDTTKSNLMEEFGFSEEEFSEALEDFQQNMPKPETAEAETANPINETPAVFEIQSTQELAGANRIEVSSVVQTERPIETVDAAETSENISFETVEDVTAVLSSEKEDESESSGNKNQNADDFAGSTFNNLMNQISSSLSEVAETEEANAQQMPRTNPQDIMEQITESIKLNITEQNTRMELQLHPASLGTVNVMIEQAKDGNMVAKFLTHNEDVKAAIEAQLQVLQEKFNEQGIKVTAVEVTVNTSGFDQTLNDSQSQKEDDQDAQESIRKPMRRIRLGDLSMDDEGIAGIDEEDQLTAEMMAINGNSVDFSA
ncbi:MAG: flagellar hook-length control protein FliK [Butyrivibrio sp.]|jgi:flagellar hook-length control protein FliK|nr:flagellar hook-length control protein FliK [Butyrivibrio sp.]